MRLKDLIGKYVNRTKPVTYLVQPSGEEVEDRSWMERHIHIIKMDYKKFYYHMPMEHTYIKGTFVIDGHFDDDNWEVYSKKKA